MALKMQYVDVYGATHSDAYFRVNNAQIDSFKRVALINVSIFHSEDARNNGKQSLGVMDYEYGGTAYEGIFGATAMDAMNPIEGIYEDLKTRDEFIGATSV